MRLFKLLVLASLLIPCGLFAQEHKNEVVVDYNNPKTYTIGDIKISGVDYLREEQILSLTGLQPGDAITIPGDEISQILKRILMQRKFSDAGFYIDSLKGKDTIILGLRLVVRPRVSRWIFTGTKKSEESDLSERLKLRRGQELSDYVVKSSTDIIKKYYKEKGFLKTEVRVEQTNDTVVKNAVRVNFVVDRGPKVKIQRITFNGNDEIKASKLARAMKKTKDKRIVNFLRSKKFNEKEYPNDKENMIQVFNEAGYRDARIVKDSMYYVEPGRMNIDFTIDKGKKYYFRDITWTGNSVYTAQQLSQVLHLEKGDVYDVVNMRKRLFGDGKGQNPDVNKMYTDNGYLFFNVTPVEVNIDGDSVDVEMRIVEGKPATFNNIIVNGNTITNEKIVRRALFTKPGYLYSQTDFERSIREIASMGHFEAEHAYSADKGYNIMPNQNNNTVDIAFNVEEKPNSQLELSGGWGGNTFVGTLGVSFNNFSFKRMFEKNAWRPVPLGDAQTLAIRFQTNGTYYTALSASFMEPWLTGKKPTSLSVQVYFTRQTNSYYYYQTSDEYMEVYGAAVGLGNRLKWPDNYFVLYHELSWQTYKLKNWNYNFLFNTGMSHNASYKISLNRNSTDQPLYPRGGSDLLLSLQLTPPYSLFRSKNTDYKNMDDKERYKWIEYHKWTFKSTLYTKLIGDLVLKTAANFGYLGYYNKDLGYSPFEGFQLGGDGMSGYNTYGSEIIGLRGYPNSSLTPIKNNAYAGNVYDKFTVELRYPVVLQPQSTIYALLFLEGGNCWSDIREFNPFQIKRSAGVGLRVFLPIVGMLGIDWGYGFDPVPNESLKRGGSQFHFVIGQQF